MKKEISITSIAGFSILFIVLVLSYSAGNYTGYNYGVDDTLDTVNRIVEKQVRSDTSVTRLLLVVLDTNTYILSKKTIAGNLKKHPTITVKDTTISP